MHEGRILHVSSEVHEDAFARRTFLQEGSILHEGTFTRVYYYFLIFSSTITPNSYPWL